MKLEHCNMKMVSERGGATVEFVENLEPNIIELIFRNQFGNKVRVTLDIERAIGAAVTRRMKTDYSTLPKLSTEWTAKLHSTCKHADKTENEYPCSACYQRDKWEEK